MSEMDRPENFTIEYDSKIKLSRSKQYLVRVNPRSPFDNQENLKLLVIYFLDTCIVD